MNAATNAPEIELRTKPQEELLAALVNELGYSGEAGSDIMASANGKEATGKLIEELLEEKRELKAHGLLSPKANGFEKITYAMIYKLCWNATHDLYTNHPELYFGFREWVAKEYAQFKDCADYCKQKVAGEVKP